MKIKERAIQELRPAEYNPRRLTEKQFSDLKKSFENLGTLEPAVINTYPGRENVIISGHQRIKIASALGMKEYPCLEVSFPPEKEREANIRMNRNNGEWDFDLLANEFDPEDLLEWGFELGELGMDGQAEGEQGQAKSLAERFLIPPFSVFDTKQGYWQDRKRDWKSLGIQSEIGRGENLLKMSETVLQPDPAKRKASRERPNPHLNEAAQRQLGFYQSSGGSLNRAGGGQTGTSIFDPVLAEIA